MSPNPSPRAPGRRRSPWPYAIIAALGFVIAVQAALLTIASGNRPVLESESAYADALEYDTIVEARRAASALGWQVHVELSRDRVQYRLRDAAGQPVSGLTGTLSLKRADTDRGDAESPFSEVAPGVYQAARPARGGVYRLAARLEGGPQPWIDDRREVFP